MSETIRLMSIDVGVANCAFYVEEFSYEDMCVGKDDDIDDRVMKCGKVVWWRVEDFSGGRKVKSVPLSDVYDCIINFVFSNRAVFDSLSGAIVERQHKYNPRAQKIECLFHSIFSMRYGGFKLFESVSASLKTKAFGFQSKSKYSRKKWAVDFANKICDARNDEGMKRVLGKSKKKDDLADSMIQLKAFMKTKLLFRS